MVEIGFNELSLNERALSKSHAASIFERFFKLLDLIANLKIATIRVRASEDIANKSISSEVYTIKDWLRSIDHNHRQRYLGYIAQQPLLLGYPYFKYNQTEVIGLAYAFNNFSVAISYSTNDIWIDSTYNLTKEFLADDLMYVQEIVTVKHCIESTDQVVHESWIKNEYANKQKIAAKSLADFDAFWEQKHFLFPWLIFTDDINNQIRLYGSINAIEFKKALRYLIQLNKHLEDVNQGFAIFDDIPGDVTEDGEATLTKYFLERTFQCPDGKNRMFSKHAKLGDVRIYLWPISSEGKYIVGYIGEHLSTVNFK